MILFKKLRWKNLFSTGNYFTEIDLRKSPTTLVIGVNGSGKSTMLDALTFALYGKPFRNINKPDIVNSINGRDCVTEVEFNVGIKEYKIRRGINPNIFEIVCDGNLVEQEGTARDYQLYLEKNILKFNYKAFTQIVILGASNFIPFMQLQAADRRLIIEDLLDIQIFSTMNTILKKRISLAQVAASEVRLQLDATMAKIELQKKHVEEAKKNNQDQIDKSQEEYNQAKAQIEKLAADITLIQKHIDQLMLKVSDEKPILEKTRQLHTLETKIETNKSKTVKQRDFYLTNDNCPTCLQDLQIEFKNKTVNEANSKISEYSTALDKLLEEQNKLNVRLGEVRDIQKKISAHNTEIVKHNTTVRHLSQYAQKMLDQIRELSTKKVLSEEMLQTSVDLVNALETLQKKRASAQELKQYHDIIAILLKDNGIKARIIKQYLPIINKLVNKYLMAMDFFVNFEIDEEFNETIKSRHRDKFSYGNFSEGEKMRIDLALLFTWRSVAKIKNNMNTNLLILDEVFDGSLDATGTEEFMKLLNTLGQDTNVFVISHKGDILVDKFRSTIKFEKVQDFSRIV